MVHRHCRQVGPQASQGLLDAAAEDYLAVNANEGRLPRPVAALLIQAQKGPRCATERQTRERETPQRRFPPQPGLERTMADPGRGDTEALPQGLSFPIPLTLLIRQGLPTGRTLSLGPA
jgi:hypothetical protein